MNKKGVALYFVLAILLVVVILANIVLNFVSSQQRLTTHQVKRVQAYYAAQAGVNYALEQLRLNNATYATNAGGTFRICGSAYKAINGTTTAICNGAGNITETSFPPSINYIDIYIGPLDLVNNNRTVNATVNYTSAY
jgi:Tfp pilus assembly protein PilX